jgi:hypothetical protein
MERLHASWHSTGLSGAEMIRVRAFMIQGDCWYFDMKKDQSEDWSGFSVIPIA